jgi:DNA/RNA-binding domain of Phe-tRNA-synthetase-like protein
MFKIKVHEAVFRQQPTFCRGLVVATGLHNRGPDAALEAQLRKACEEAVQSAIDLATDQRFVTWSEAFRAFGAEPKRFAPAHLALRKRVQKPGAGLPFINKAVCVMNLASLQGAMPVGGDDLTRAAEFGDVLELRPAAGDETFVPLGQPEQAERPEPGEIILAVNREVCCRRWCWRNGHLTRLVEQTTSLVMNVDGLGADSQARVVALRDQVAELLKQHCNATITTGLLSPMYTEFLVPVTPPSRLWEPTEG